MSASQEALERTIGYSFRDPALLRRALTHKSFAYESSVSGGPPPPDSAQLEFLGDAVLGLLVTDLLVQRHPEQSEGRLTELKAHLVREASLVEVARRVRLGDHLLLGEGEERSGGRDKAALLADALEALIAAIYLDSGLEAARGFVVRHVVGPWLTEPDALEAPLSNFKSALQAEAHARGLPLPRYVVVGESGPQHAKTFTVEVRLGPDWVVQAEAATKKAAGQKAAALLLEKLKAIKPGA